MTYKWLKEGNFKIGPPKHYKYSGVRVTGNRFSWSDFDTGKEFRSYWYLMGTPKTHHDTGTWFSGSIGPTWKKALKRHLKYLKEDK